MCVSLEIARVPPLWPKRLLFIKSKIEGLFGRLDFFRTAHNMTVLENDLAKVTSGLSCPSRAKKFVLSWIDSSLIEELLPQKLHYSSWKIHFSQRFLRKLGKSGELVHLFPCVQGLIAQDFSYSSWNH